MDTRFRYAAQQAYRLFATHARKTSRIANLDCTVFYDGDTAKVKVQDVVGTTKVFKAAKSWAF